MILFYILTHLPLQMNNIHQNIYLILGEVSTLLLLIYMIFQSKKIIHRDDGYKLISCLFIIYGIMTFLGNIDHILRPTHILGLVVSKYTLINQQPLIVIILILNLTAKDSRRASNWIPLATCSLYLLMILFMQNPFVNISLKYFQESRFILSIYNLSIGITSYQTLKSRA
ncbi:hypothetical protein EZV73_04975 [Acidaminobacter sp. JC074]|uniref:hypothetical protein n=1 Tax=Acidaminobacter sp. JC074 TaxID=2530199 RepID=UPI001F0E674D|nr:hypothetical protein [Acidaminobacter sp. JC074]MCH4886907.1 hypothetical protein [Acidaminobacter sp. JC074]